MRFADKTSMLPGPACGEGIDPAILANAANDRAPVFPFDRAAKRAFDIVAASMGLVLFSPMLLLVSIAIKIDSRGPVLRRQMLRGYDNEDVHLLTFRTTVFSSTEKSASIVTGVGDVLRRTRIDGLPRLINVLRGEMSIVGPSPNVATPSNVVAERIPLIRLGHTVKLLMTSSAQVNG